MATGRWRWIPKTERTQLASFDYDIKYHSGKSNINADSLSRCPFATMPAQTPDEECNTERDVTTAAIELAHGGEDGEWVNSEWAEGT